MKKIIAIALAALMTVSVASVFASAEDANLASGKSYTTKGIYADGSGTVLYPDESGNSLTDGSIGDAAAFSDAAFVGFNTLGEGNTEADPISNIVVDLGSSATLSKFVLTALDNLGEAGISAPTTIAVSVSEDNATWTDVGTATEDTTPEAAEIVTYTVSASATGRYVKFAITHASNWAFVSEVAAYGTAGGTAAEESSEAPATSSEAPAASSEAPAASSEAASKAPVTGDAGLVAFAVIALVAAAGVVVAKKSR